MELVLVIATVLGGIAAIVYFAERWRFRRQLAEGTLPQPGAPPEIPAVLRTVLNSRQEFIAVFPAAAHEWHNAGSVVPDDEATDGKAWLSDSEDRGGHVVYGPYVRLRRPGRYTGWFRLRFRCPDGDPSREAIRVEVVHAGTHDARLLRCGANDGAYDVCSVGFLYQANEKVELRVEKLRQAKVWVDFTAISRDR